MITKNLEELTIFAVETHKDSGVPERVIHFFGYGYFCDCHHEKPYRFVEYTFFYRRLEEVIEKGFVETESEFSPEIKQYITDLDEEGLKNVYKRYDNGYPPKIIREKELNKDTPDGLYIFVPDCVSIDESIESLVRNDIQEEKK